jgi:TonB family protein
MRLREIILLTLFVAAPAVAAEPAPRAPSGPWTVSFADAQCVAMRNYGTAEDPVHLTLKAPPLGDVMQLAVMKRAPNVRPAQVAATVQADQHPPLRTNLLTFTSGESGLRVYLLNMASADFTRVRDARTLSVRSSGLNETFTLSNVAPMMRAMERCVTDLRRVWNVVEPTGEQSRNPRRPSANLASLFRPEDYPHDAAVRERQGRVGLVVLVDEAGQVADCTVIATSGVAALDAQSCAVMKARARYEPARDSDGRPAKDAVIARISWRLSD